MSLTYAVFRDLPLPEGGRIRWHYWQEGDRWDLLAVRYLKNSSLWYRLLDFNPGIQDPAMVDPGQPIAIPADA